MMKVIALFHDTAQKMILESTGDKKITWGIIYTVMREQIVKITNMKFELPRQPDQHFKTVYGQLVTEVETTFANLSDHV